MAKENLPDNGRSIISPETIMYSASAIFAAAAVGLANLAGEQLGQKNYIGGIAYLYLALSFALAFRFLLEGPGEAS